MNATTIDIRHYEATDTLPDGSPVYLRAIRPDDKKALQQGLAGFSRESSYQRFLGIKKSFTDAELIAYTEPDFVNHVALVTEVEVDGQRIPVGIGRYFTTESESGSGPAAEVSFAVRDDFQHHGLGTILLHHLTALARSADIVELRAWVLGQNRGMLGVFQHAPGQSTFRYRDNLIEVVLKLD